MHARASKQASQKVNKQIEKYIKKKFEKHVKMEKFKKKTEKSKGVGKNI